VLTVYPPRAQRGEHEVFARLGGIAKAGGAGVPACGCVPGQALGKEGRVVRVGGMCSPPRPGCAPVVLLHWPWRPPHSSLHIPEWCSSSLVWGTGARWITCAQIGKYGVLC
jgi:hypothetical protein